MNRLFALAALLGLPLSSLAAEPAPTTKPNFVFILTDDQRWNTLGCMGDPLIHTPNVDRLAREGVRTEQWTYLRWVNEQPVVEELYDLKADPLEEHNLASAPGQAGMPATLRARWQEFAAELK